jgi:peptidoglycan/xylan/chitin deacetylase (PgdA/CDA1 family)
MLAVGALAVLLAGGHALQDHGRAVKSVATGQKIIALTFDDGPHPQTTPALLAVLAAKNVRATFFLLGENVAKYPGLAAAVATAGQETASHGYRHLYPNRLPREKFLADLALAEEAIAAASGTRPALYRPPGGGYNDKLIDELALRGYTTVLWSVDPRDWEKRGAAQTAADVVRRAAPGAIVLLHEGDYAANTPAAVALLIDRLAAEGYGFVTVGELLGHRELRD